MLRAADDLSQKHGQRKCKFGVGQGKQQQQQRRWGRMSHHHHHHLDLGLCALQADWLALPSSTVTTTTPPAATLIWWRPCDAFFLVRVSLSTICVFALYANQAAATVGGGVTAAAANSREIDHGNGAALAAVIQT